MCINTHKCISVEEADAKLLPQLEDVVHKVKASIKLSEEKLITEQLSKDILENDKSKMLESVNILINNVKGKLQVEYEKTVGEIDECNKINTIAY